MRVLAAALALLLLAGCSSTAVTPEVAKAAPARLKADMGPDGGLRQATSTITMSMGMGGMSMRMAFGIVEDFYQHGAFQATVTVKEFSMPQQSGGQAAPDLTGAVLRILCTPDRWVVITQGMGDKDASLETANSRGTCALDKPDEAGDLMRLLGTMDSDAGPMLQGMMTGLASAPDYEFVAVDGGVATYRVKESGSGMGSGMPANVTATFDGDGRIAHVDTVMQVPMVGMSMRAAADYEYGSRSAAPDLHGDRKA